MLEKLRFATSSEWEFDDTIAELTTDNRIQTKNLGTEASPVYSTDDILLTAPFFFRTDQFSKVVDLGANARVIINRGGSPVYWTGSAWAASDLSFSQSNPVAALDSTALAALAPTKQTFGLYIVLQSPDASTLSEFQWIEFTVEFFTSSRIWGYLYQKGGAPAVNQTVKVKCESLQEFPDNLLLPKMEDSAITDTEGYFSVRVPYDSTEEVPDFLIWDLGDFGTFKTEFVYQPNTNFNVLIRNHQIRNEAYS